MSQGLNVTTFWQPSNNGSFPTHIDIYGKGGFVAIITTTENPNINDHITPLRRKEGMLVYDVTTDKYYRCLSELSSENDANWTEENFGGPTVGIQEGTGISVNVTEESIYTISLNASLNDLNNVTAPNPSNGQVLTWNGINWVPQTITIQAEGTDGLVANALAPFILWTEDGSLPDSKTLIGDGIIGIDTEYTDNAHVLLFIEDNSITNNKLVNKTISGVELGQDLFALTFGVGLFSPEEFNNYDGSSEITLSIDFGTGIDQVARGNHTHTLDELTDVTVSSATEGNVLVYAGTDGWVNTNFIYGGSANSFA